MPRDSRSSTRLGTHRYSGDESQSGRGTQANTYSDRTRSQGPSSDPGEGSRERRLNRRRWYRRHAVGSGAEVLGTITRKWRECGIDLGKMLALNGSPRWGASQPPARVGDTWGRQNRLSAGGGRAGGGKNKNPPPPGPARPAQQNRGRRGPPRPPRADEGAPHRCSESSLRG